MKKITFSIIALFLLIYTNAQCDDPTNVELINQSFSPYINWDNIDGVVWDIEYDEHGFTPTGIPTVENLNFSTYFINNMLDSTYYDFYVRTDCDNETSNWVGPFTFYNYCMDNIFGDINENFSGDFLPNCWTEGINGDLTTGPEVFIPSNWEIDFFANTGSNPAAKININNGTNDWLIVPLLTYFSPIRNSKRTEIPLQIQFDIALTQHSTTDTVQLGLDDSFELLISPDYGMTWFSINTWDSNSIISNTGETVSFSYNHGTHGFDLFDINFLIVFRANSGVTTDSNVDLYLDNLTIIPPFDDEASFVNDLETFGFSYFPNPIKNTLKITAFQNIDSIIIYNSLGKEIKNISINAVEKEINLTDIESGVYFMKVQIGNTIGTVPLIKS